jgi:uncharacterized protein YwgA
MNESTDLVLRLLNELDTVEGRTMMQKIVFIIKAKFDQFHDFPFSIHYYGPFSRDLTEELDTLRLQGLIEEVPRQLQDFVRYDIKLTDEGKRKISRTARSVSTRKLQEMTRLARTLSSWPLNRVIDEAYSLAEQKGLD